MRAGTLIRAGFEGLVVVGLQHFPGTLYVHGRNLKKSASELPPEDKSASVGGRLDKVIDCGCSQELFKFESLAQALCHEQKIEFRFSEKLGGLPHDYDRV